MSLRELAEAPYAYRHIVTSDGTWDPLTVSAAEILVRRPDGTETSWTVETPLVASATEITLTHVLAAGGVDLPRGTSGTWSFRPRLVVPGGVLYGAPVQLIVRSAFEAP